MKPNPLALVALCYLNSSIAFSPQPLLKNERHTTIRTTSLNVVEEKLEPAPTSSPNFDFSDPLKPVVLGEELAIPFMSGPVKLNDEVTNEGPYSWMIPYISAVGFKVGNTMNGAVPTSEITSNYSEEVKEELRRKAAEEMVNISDRERNTRREMSNVCYKATAIYAGISAIILDDGSFAGHLFKLAIFLPLAAAYGLQLSAERGLWNIGQGGLWDVAGEIEPIQDPNLAQAMIEKVNALNNESGILPLIAAITWSALPQELSSSIGVVSLSLTALYLLRDKIPKTV